MAAIIKEGGLMKHLGAIVSIPFLEGQRGMLEYTEEQGFYANFYVRGEPDFFTFFDGDEITISYRTEKGVRTRTYEVSLPGR